MANYRACVCGKKIKWRHSLCKTCLQEYGPDRSAWPAWLLRWVRDVQNEINADRRHDERSLSDETLVDPDDSARFDPDEGLIDPEWERRYQDALRMAEKDDDPDWDEPTSLLSDDDLDDDEDDEDDPPLFLPHRHAPYDNEADNLAYRRANGIPERRR